MLKTILFFAVFIFSANLFPENKYENISLEMNLDASHSKNFDTACLPVAESYKKYVFEARYVRSIQKEKYAARLYRKHLRCWDDKYIFKELGEFYISEEKLYLAALTYKEGELTSEYNKVKSMRNKIGENDFELSAKEQAVFYNNEYKNKKAIAQSMMILGPIISLSGLGLLIHDLAGSQNSKTAQFSLMIGGLSVFSGGIVLNLSAEKTYNISLSYRRISREYKGDNGTLPSEYFLHSGIERETRRRTASTYKNHGLALIGISVPMIAVAVYGFFESYNYHNEKTDEDCSHGLCDIEMLGHILQMFSLAPAILSLTGGIIMLAKSAKYEKLSTEPTLFTLNSIAPIIDPVSKTYGLSMGFSF